MRENILYQNANQMKTVYIPEGLPNLKPLFPNIDFNEIEEWTVSAHVNSKLSAVATSRKNSISSCCEDYKLRVHFVNSLGEIDSINLKLIDSTLEVKSQNWTKSIPLIFDRTKGGSYRNNITSNDIIEAETNVYNEGDQYWLKDIFRTGLAWLEMNLPNGFNNSVKKEYVPIEISDGKLVERKSENRFEYLVKIRFVMSNANINLR
jgi:hypothetical protein